MISLRYPIAGLGIAAAAFVVGQRFTPAPAPRAAAEMETSPSSAESVTQLRVVAAEGPDPQDYARLVRRVVREELDLRQESRSTGIAANSDSESDNREATDEATDDVESERISESRSELDAVIVEAIELGEWSAKDAESIRTATAQLPVADAHEAHRRLMQAVVDGEVVVAFNGPLF